MKQAQRVYVYGEGDGIRLIQGTHPDSVKSFATATVPVKVASQADLIELLGKGIKVELSRPINAELPLDNATAIASA
jgi:hypothetical protein